MEALALPSKDALPVTSPVKEIVLAVASFVAVAAFPEHDPAVVALVALATAEVTSVPTWVWDDAALPSNAVCNPSTLDMTWL